jgi:uncharacterized protein YjbI with pentapeptide repeats
MANEEHLSLLKQGVESWNAWRLANTGVRPDLTGADLSRADLTEADLSGANLSSANLRRADLSRANLNGADLGNVDLRDARLRAAQLVGVPLVNANLSGAQLEGTNLTGANLSSAALISANLTGASFDAANLNGANLITADLFLSAFGGAQLVKAKLSEANLTSVNLIDANLSQATLDRATLRDCVLNRTNFTGTRIVETIMVNLDLSTCIGLDSIDHRGPSSLGIDSIIRSKGQIPKTFLRGIGLPDEWIDYIPSLVGDGIQFYSCFISYSSADKAFAIRLHDALQSNGIRCWLDEKQLLPGDDISRELERGIHVYDKFLLCASENSLTSWWVEGEIQTCLEKEQKLQKERGKSVLKVIPLNLDGYMFTDQWDLGVFAKKITSRVAADFRGWDKPGFNFNEQVARVIKALRADEGARVKPPPSKL